MPFLPVLLVQGILAFTTVQKSVSNTFTWNGASYNCKCYEGDKCWPPDNEWKKLNTSVDGNLQIVIPDGAVCHNTFDGKPTYNATACDEVQKNFGSQQWQ